MRRVYTLLTESYIAIGWLRRRKQYISGHYALIVSRDMIGCSDFIQNTFLHSMYIMA